MTVYHSMSQRLRQFARGLNSTISRRFSRSRQSPAQSDPRYNACQILYDAGFVYVIWAEDALSWHGVPTMTFDLLLLVEDTDKAAKTLLDSGYIMAGPNPRYSCIPQFSFRIIPNSASAAREDEFTVEGQGSDDVYESEDPALTAVVLLSAKDWNYDVSLDAFSQDSAFPPLARFMDSLISTWLDVSDEDDFFMMQLATYISYLYFYNESVTSPGFEVNLRNEHRQFHFDQLAGIYSDRLNTCRCKNHYRVIRDQTLSGEMQPSRQPRNPGDVADTL